MANFILRNGTIYINEYYGQPNPIMLSTKIKIDQSKWDKTKQRAKSANYTYKGLKINNELIKHASALSKAFQYYKENRGFSKDNIRLKYLEFLSPGALLPNRKQVIGFLEFFEQRKDLYKSKDINNWVGYQSTLKHLNSFFKKRKPRFEEVDSRFYELFNDFLLNMDLSVNTVSKDWKNIKAIMRVAKNQKLHSNTDFESFKRKSEETDTIYLTENELKAIYKLKLKGSLDLARDYFLIGCYTGLRYSDWDKLNSSVIKDGIAKIRSSKTGELSTIPIPKKVTAILKKYNGSLAKKFSNQIMNKHIKTIGLHAKITEDVTIRSTEGLKKVETTSKKYMLMSTHTARRSFATILVLKKVSPYVIIRITGHRSLKTFESYVKISDLYASMELKGKDFFK